MKAIRATLLALCIMLVGVCSSFTAMAYPATGGQEGDSDAIKAYGCDLSFWNVGGYSLDYTLVDFEKMKAAGCDFVILRFGFEGTQWREDQMDTAFLTLYHAAKAAGLDVGAYFYALATDYNGAAEDARWCINLFEQHNLSFEYPIYYDVEDPGNDLDRPGHDALDAQQTTDLCLGWAQTLEAAGYYPGVYGDYELVTKLLPTYTDYYDVWYAYVAYVEGIPEFIPEEMPQSSLGGLWQYSWKGHFNGVDDVIDVDVAYKDYPTIMRENGYNNVAPLWKNTTSVMPDPIRFRSNAYADSDKAIVSTYHTDGSVTLTSGIVSNWAWPSAYLACYQKIDLNKTPILTLEKSGTAHCNLVLAIEDSNGSVRTVTLSDVTGEPNGEFAAGEKTVMADIGAHLREKGLYPDEGVLKLHGVTYYVMGATGAYATFKEVGFTASPYPLGLTSSVYTVESRMISRVPANLTVSEFLAGLDQKEGVEVFTAENEHCDQTDSVASGMTVTLSAQGNILKRYTVSVIGDLNGDARATTVDARLALGSFLEDGVLTECQILSADFDADGEVKTSDIRELLKTLVI